jgi:hypothetical protein
MEAAGALATAGAVAGVVEGREPLKAGEGACLNCGAPIIGRFCAQCGQATFAHRSLLHMAGEFLHGLFGFDTKIWRTVPQLISRPGTLTRDYVYGKRARYISPLALFLLCIFLMFFVFSFMKAPVQVEPPSQERRAEALQNLAEAREGLAEAQRALAEEQAAPANGMRRDIGVRLSQAVTRAQTRVARREAAIRRIDAAEAARQAQQPANAAPQPGANAANVPSAETPSAQPAPSSREHTTGAPAASDDDKGFDALPGESWQDTLRRMAQQPNFHASDNPRANERIRQDFLNPDLALYKTQEAASKFSFLLAPLSLPFIALLFLWKRGVHLYDHVVYALYALSFAALLFVAVMLTAQTPWTARITPWLVVVGLPAHTFFHLKGAYALGWFSALWRTFFMLTFAVIILFIFVVLIFIVGLVG